MEQVGEKDELKKREISAAADFFETGKILSFSFIKKGNINSNYILRTKKGKFVLRAYKFKKEEEIKGELELLNFLSKKGFPCPAPVGGIFKAKNKFICCFKYIEGREPKNITIGMLKETARLLAEMHNLTANYRTKYKREGEGLAVIKKYIQNKKGLILASKFKNAEKFITYLETEIRKISFSENLPFGAIHVDVKKENIIAGKSGQLHFIDFDNFYFDFLAMDIGSALAWLGESKERLNIAKAKKFLAAYEEVRMITESEKRNLKEVMKFHCLKGMFKYAYICLPRLKFAEHWAYYFMRFYKNISQQEINF